MLKGLGVLKGLGSCVELERGVVLDSCTVVILVFN